ncbi:uncharacterized protein LOC144881258 [Branchiostoma floridae x Branchiostoma japonicum]
MYRPDGGYTGSWSWLNYQGRWGNRKVSNVPFTMYRPDGGYTGSWSWLNYVYQGRWGNRKVSNVPFTMYRPDGGYTGSWSWLNYQGRWGNRKDGCNAFIEGLSGECVLNDGPQSISTRPPMKTDKLD